LPDDLELWIRAQDARLGRRKTLASPSVPLIMKDPDSRLRIRLVPEFPDDFLILDQEQTTVEVGPLQRLGTTARPAEVRRARPIRKSGSFSTPDHAPWPSIYPTRPIISWRAQQNRFRTRATCGIRREG